MARRAGAAFSPLASAVAIFLVLGATVPALPAQGNGGGEVEYRARLAANPNDSRALYLLAELRREHPREAVALLEQYTALEPRDAWGFIALGTALGRARRIGAALRAYDVAERLAPRERDVTVGRARMLAGAGRTDAAIGVLERWCFAQPVDAEALRELAALYRRAGRLRTAIKTVERTQSIEFDARAVGQLDALRSTAALHLDPVATSSRDSDGNSISGVGVLLGFVGDGTEIAVAGSARRVSDGLDATRLGDARATFSWRPRATIRILAEVGGVAAPTTDDPVRAPPRPGVPFAPPPSEHALAIVPTGRLRYIWREGDGTARIDLRGGRVLLDASPLLVRNRVTRSELGGEGEVRLVGPVALRATVRAAAIESSYDDNTRSTLGGRLAIAVPIAGEITAGWQRMVYARPSDAGYFAPRAAQTAEVGSYREIELDNGVTFAFDLGAGGQRVAEWSEPVGQWSPAFRGWAALGIPFAPGRELRVEAEAYDARLGGEVASTGSRWRYASLSATIRWSVR